MNKQTKGIHHITAIVGSPQENIDFYSGILGLRLVKQTVNFDAPDVYHFYFGNRSGEPGTIMTFFPWENAAAGMTGAGQVGWTTFAVPAGALPFWQKRLEENNVEAERISRFNESYLQFRDPHGLPLEITERTEGAESEWVSDAISADNAIKGFGGVVLFSANPEKTMDRLENTLGLKKVLEEENYVRFQAGSDRGQKIDVKLSGIGQGVQGAGTVHHIAWRSDNIEDQVEWQEHIFASGLRTTEILDRQYFKSIYYREEGGILFEMATDTPGFLIDEDEGRLGEELKLPEWLEPKREVIRRHLPEVLIRSIKEGKS